MDAFEAGPCGPASVRRDFAWEALALRAKLAAAGIALKCMCDEVVVTPHVVTMNAADVSKRWRLEAEEFRAQRKKIDGSGEEFAQRLGVTPSTVSRWEKGATPISSSADRV